MKRVERGVRPNHVSSAFLWVFFGCLSLLLSSCRKEPLNQLSAEETRVYVTNYNPSVDFSAYQTFSLVDSVALLSGNNSGRRTELTTSDLAFLSAIRSEMSARGYVEVGREADPDLGINVSKIDVSFSTIVPDFFPGYWAGWGGYWDPFYWGFGGVPYNFPVFFSVLSYRQSAWLIDVVDLENVTNNELNVVWNAQMEGAGILNPNAAANAVQAAFAQSSYFTRN
jgi:hypothetical protein